MTNAPKIGIVCVIVYLEHTTLVNVNPMEISESNNGPHSQPFSNCHFILQALGPCHATSHMPVDPEPGDTGQAHLVSLVIQSKNALQRGEQLCTRAHTASNASAQAAIDVLALDAKIKWMVEAVVEQLKVGSCEVSITSIDSRFSLRQVLLRVLKRSART
jgi:hypothetical protein